MSQEDNLYERISLSQNSILAWLGAGLGASIGVIELSSSKIPHKIWIFEFLVIFIVFSFGMVVSHMCDAYYFIEKLKELGDIQKPLQWMNHFRLLWELL